MEYPSNIAKGTFTERMNGHKTELLDSPLKEAGKTPLCPTQEVEIAPLPHEINDPKTGLTAFVPRLQQCTSPCTQSSHQTQDLLPRVGDRFLNFILIGVLGRGAFGKVYLARQPELADRLVAIKISSEIRGEPETLARLQHPNIVPVYSVHRTGILQGVCMPYCGSVTLANVIENLNKSAGHFPSLGRALLSAVFERKGTEPTMDGHYGGGRPEAASPSASPIRALMERMTFVDAVVWLIAHIADGLAHAHKRGILHRDLKPANILISDEGQPMLLDFNLARDQRIPQKEDRTKLGGTLPYMSPELLEACRGGQQPIDERNDLYALGVIFYELLTGRLPFEELSGPMDLIILPMLQAKQRGATSPRLHNPTIPKAVASIVLKLLEPDLSKRYRSAVQLREDLECHLTHQPLKYATDRSMSERLDKWRLRHPRLTATGFVGLATGLILSILGAAVLLR